MDLKSEFEETFSDEEVIISDDIKFKSSLGIGEKAFHSLKMRENLTTAGETLGVYATVAGAVAPVGALFGLKGAGLFGTALFAGPFVPATSVVVSAGLIGAAAYFGLSRLLTKGKDEKLLVIPKFINTPLDLLATSLVGFFIPLALKVSMSDGHIHDLEKLKVKEFLVKRWGYSEIFIEKAIEIFEQDLGSTNYEDITSDFVEFVRANPDCDPKEVGESLITLLEEVIKADGIIKVSEQKDIEQIKSLLV